MRVLVVEDEQDLANAIGRGLRHEGMAVDLAFEGAAALEKGGVNDYDVIVLDRDLPGVHGDDVCRELIAGGRPARLLMLTASATVGDRVEGLELGADDYLGKPFHFEELVARVRALGRRSGSPTPPQLERGGVRLDPAQRSAWRGGRGLRLTRKEFAVLEILLAAAGAVVSSEDLLEKAWDENVDPLTNAVRMTLVTLRKALGEPPLIETVVGVGYRIP